MEQERKKYIPQSLFDRNGASNDSAFIIKPVSKAVDHNPLDSTVSINKVKEQTNDESPAKCQSLFDLKGNSKNREEVRGKSFAQKLEDILNKEENS